MLHHPIVPTHPLLPSRSVLTPADLAWYRTIPPKTQLRMLKRAPSGPRHQLLVAARDSFRMIRDHLSLTPTCLDYVIGYKVGNAA